MVGMVQPLFGVVALKKGNSFVLGLEAVISTSGLLRPVPACLMVISFPHKPKEPPDCHFNRMALYQSIWSFTLMISFQDYFRILPDCIDPLFGCHLLSCPGKDRQFCFFRLLIVPHIIVLLTFRSFPTMIKISSSHWTLPPFPETFVCLFLIGDSILQYLFLFVNYFLKIYFYFFNISSLMS